MASKRRFAVAVVGVLALLAVSGCVQPPSAPPDPLISCDSLLVSSSYDPPATDGADDGNGTFESPSSLTGCTDRTGRGISGATLNGTFEVDGACQAHSPTQEWGSGTGQITWSNGAVSNYSAVLLGGSPLRVDLQITGGFWNGATASVPMNVISAEGTCGGSGLTQVAIEGGLFILRPAGSSGSKPLSGVQSIAAGGYHTCALLDSSGVKCWGDLSQGQLGNGQTDPGAQKLLPVNVVGLGPVSALSAGEYHTCALVAGGEARCWGQNTDGRLGDGTNASSNVPVEVVGLSGATSISAGPKQTCAVVAGGAVECWGNGSLVPATVPGISGATAVSVGNAAAGPHACALVEDGAVMCWGNNSHGQLGDGTNLSSSEAVAVVGVVGATSLATSPYGSSCAATGGAVKCWGNNEFGQLGDGTTANTSLAVSVQGVSNAAEVGLGAVHGCARLSGGSATCWGNNAYGQLGNGAALPVNPPAAVSGLTNASSISVGHYHSCAVKAGGTAACWGANSSGQLGTGNRVDAPSPSVVQRGL